MAASRLYLFGGPLGVTHSRFSRVEMATDDELPKKPQDREKAIAAAYLRVCGATQAKAARIAGIGKRTLERYEQCMWWPEIVAEARDPWLDRLQEEAMRVLMRGLDAELSLKVLERLYPKLAPAASRLDLTSGGEALPDTITFRFIDPSDDDE